ncbi:MAG: universal stress protein [Parvibaculum sp.]|uniref:universal stress protein n=1 Tax=Parvibaculum sp. TaxID=2024848 RepID=UPI000CBB8357|nr:universal stress protein [Parvibaculum sp.]MDZ4380865.1 universal stress protein [Parvibaculum sp.]PKP76581.1 MAG: universal stress protein UspA [Alphaproteobacteria bacterium HGW-Alphaproteobacteria-3]
MSESETSSQSAALQKRRKFLVIVDGTPESEVAIHFASLRASHTGGVVTLLAVIEPGEASQQWLGVKNIMREEAREEAEELLHRLAAHVNEYAGIMPELIIREGRRDEQVMQLIREDKDVAILVLAAGTGKEGPGPLVSMVASASEKAFPIPVTVVPGDLTEEALRSLA